MGTDIHIAVEEQMDDGTWRIVKPPYRSRWDDGYSWSPWAESNDFDDPRPDPTVRNYAAFAFLADVRNGYGFAGVITHEPVEAQFPNRGLPEDSPFYATGEVDDHSWLGDHSFTWATLEELLNAPWEVEFKQRGVVGYRGYREWKEKGLPTSWSGDVCGPGVTIHPLEKFEQLYSDAQASGYDALAEQVGSGDYTTVEWVWQPIANCSFRKWVRWLRDDYLADRDPRKVRVLMGFDS